MRKTLSREQRQILDLIECATGFQLNASLKTKTLIADLFRTTPTELRGNLDALDARCNLCARLRDTLDRTEIDALGSLVKKPNLAGSGFTGFA